MYKARIESAKADLEVCAACSGTWFDKDEVARLSAALGKSPATRLSESPHTDIGPRQAGYATAAALPLMLIGYWAASRRPKDR